MLNSWFRKKLVNPKRLNFLDFGDEEEGGEKDFCQHNLSSLTILFLT